MGGNKNNAEALEFAGTTLKGDKDIVLESVKKVGWTICYANEKLQDDKDIVLAAVQKVDKHYITLLRV